MRRSAAPILLAFALIASCKPPKAKHPLSDPAQAKPDPRLAGLWSGTMERGRAPVMLYAVQRSGALLDLVLFGDDGERGAAVLHFEAFPTVLGGKTYLNLRHKVLLGEYGETPQVDAEYLFARYELAGDGSLKLSLMDEDAIKKAVADKRLEGSEEAGAVMITAGTPQLSEFVRKADPARLFSRVASLRRTAPARPR